MKLEKVKELVELMKANDLDELEIVDGQTRIVLKRTGRGSPPVVISPPVVGATGIPAGAPAGVSAAPASYVSAGAPGSLPPGAAVVPPGGSPTPPPGVPAFPGPETTSAPAEESADEKLLPVKAPIVGTFYAAPSPSAEPFVQVGSRVDEETVVCIVEAMKVMNEVKAQHRGIIRKILVENGQAVEFGQPLFLVEPE